MVYENIAGMALDQMKTVEGSNAKFLTAKNSDIAEIVKAMFSVSWEADLEATAFSLKDSDDEVIFGHALEGLKHAIHLFAVHDMEQRSTFLQSLHEFTSLSGDLSAIKPKNIEAIKTLLAVGVELGNYLGDSWQEVLRCVSQLELAAVVGSETQPRKNKIPGVVTETSSQTMGVMPLTLKIAMVKTLNSTEKANGVIIVGNKLG